jgi:hypothetical protein
MDRQAWMATTMEDYRRNRGSGDGNDLELLGAKPECLGVIMAHAHAIPHWRAHGDANDRESVCSTRPLESVDEVLEAG